MPSLDEVVFSAPRRRDQFDIYDLSNPQNSAPADRGSETDDSLAFISPAGAALEALAGSTGTVAAITIADLAAFALVGPLSVVAGMELYNALHPTTPREDPFDPQNQVEVSGRRPPPPNFGSNVIVDPPPPPNFSEIAYSDAVFSDVRPQTNLFDEIFDFAGRIGSGVFDILMGRVQMPRDNANTEIEELDPAISPQLAPRPAVRPQPGTLADPLMQPDPAPAPAIRPGTAPGPGIAPLFDPQPAPTTTPRPTIGPNPFISPDPLISPRTDSPFLPLTGPFTGTPTRPSVDTPPQFVGFPGFPAPLTPFEPLTLESPQVPRGTGLCPPCTTTAQKRPKKKQEDRAICFEGKFREYSRGVFKFSKVRVPCEPKPKAARKKTPKYPPGNPFPRS